MKISFLRQNELTHLVRALLPETRDLGFESPWDRIEIFWSFNLSLIFLKSSLILRKKILVLFFIHLNKILGFNTTKLIMQNILTIPPVTHLLQFWYYYFSVYNVFLNFFLLKVILLAIYGLVINVKKNWL